MDERTREALEGSIAKWQAIVDGSGVDDGGANCPLCAEFADQVDPDHGPDDEGDLSPDAAMCHGCPVKATTGQWGCNGTPYMDWAKTVEFSLSLEGLVRRAESDADRALARAELEFLQSLRPEGEK